MVSVWGLGGCHIPSNLGTLLPTKLRQPQVVIGSTVWSLFLDATRICPVCLWPVRIYRNIVSYLISDPLFLVGRLNRPGLMVYGGTIRPGSCEGAPQLDIVSAFQSYGKYLQDGQTPEAERERYNTVRHACPGPGACGGVCFFRFYTFFKFTLRKDVYCQHNGQCRRGSWNDTTWLIFIPR
jgi:hypothetical protein